MTSWVCKIISFVLWTWFDLNCQKILWFSVAEWCFSWKSFVQRVSVTICLHPWFWLITSWPQIPRISLSGINLRGMTLAIYPHELFKSEATSLHFADLSLLYSVLGPVGPLYSFSFHWCVSWVSDSSNLADGPVRFSVTECQQETSCHSPRHFSSSLVSIFFFGTIDVVDSIFSHESGSVHSVFAYHQFSAKVLYWLHFLHRVRSRTHQIPQVHSGATEQICPGGSCPEILEPLW